MIHSLVSKEEEKKIKKVWEKLDIDGDGQLTFEEMLLGMTEIYNEQFAQKECTRIF